MKEFRIREVNLQPGVTWFFPQEGVIAYKQKGMWWWKTYEEVHTWKYLINFNQENTYAVEGDVSFSQADNLVSFKDIEEAKTWLFQYKAVWERKVNRFRDKLSKANSLSENNPDKIHKL